MSATNESRLLADYGSRKLFMQEGQNAVEIKPYIENSIGHHQEWIAAIKNGTPTGSNFAYATNLTESVLLGNVSYRAGQKKLEWDSEQMKATNLAAADKFITRKYRKGWTL